VTLIVLRPQPGAAATAARARALGLATVEAPLFRIAARPWSLPPGPFDAVLLTSANAPRLLERVPPGLAERPAYAVGAATAAAARDAGFTRIVAGDSDVADLVRRAAGAGIRTMLHLAGADRTDFDPGPIAITTRIVYAAEAVDPPPALPAPPAVALLHSSRAARRFRDVASATPGYAVAAISLKVAAAAGGGWRAVAVAATPDDDALLAAAAGLCQ
jgi:uroporphyrinogen-III synthase